MPTMMAETPAWNSVPNCMSAMRHTPLALRHTALMLRPMPMMAAMRAIQISH